MNAIAAATTTLAKHRIIECYECNPDVLNDPVELEKVLLKSARDSGATIVGSHFHTFEPQGVSGIVVVAESHFSVHSWPEYRYAAVDAFGCGDSIDIDIALAVLREGLETEDIVLAGDLERGHLNDGRVDRVRVAQPRAIERGLTWRQRFEREDAWGIQSAIDIHECDPALIRDEDHVRQFAIDLSDHIKMRRFGDAVVVDFGENERVSGFSLVQLIETSLISGHFVNQVNNSHIDIFSCAYYDPEVAAEFSRDYFQGLDFTLQVTLRK
jgi:S-adenosylmethionine decarboxylase